jgi:hypothetical protein
MKSIVLLLLAMVLAACAGITSRSVPVEFSSKEIVVGAPILIRAEHFSAWFQYGEQVTQRQLTIWDDYCNIRIKGASRPESWYWEEGRYRIKGFNWFDDMCSRRDCDLVQLYQLETLSGVEAAELTCRYRYAFSDIQGLTGPHFLSPQQLDAILGDYLNLVEPQ